MVDMIKDEIITTAGAGSRTVPAGITVINIELWGAGAGAHGSHGGASAIGGGGAGGKCRRISKTVTSGQSISFDIGAGGLGDVGHIQDQANSGGDSTCDGMTAGGGQGSLWGVVAGVGGTATGGDENTVGGNGDDPSSPFEIGRKGGDSPDGGVGGASVSIATDGNDGIAPGGGAGSGGKSNLFPASAGTDGGDGASGGVRFTWGDAIGVPTKNLILTGLAPVIVLDLFASVPETNLPITGVAAVISIGKKVSVPSLNIPIAAVVPVVTADTMVFATTANMAINTPIPMVSIDFSLRVPETNLPLIGHAPIASIRGYESKDPSTTIVYTPKEPDATLG